MTFPKRTLACLASLAAAATLALAPVSAAAQSCTPRPQSQHCLSKFGPGGSLDMRGEAGGIVACPGGTQRVQYDYYTVSGGNFAYVCTRILRCSQIQGSPAWKEFC